MNLDVFVTFRIGTLFAASDGRHILCSADSVLGVSAQMLARTKTVRGDWSVVVDGGLTTWTRRGAGADKVLFE